MFSEIDIKNSKRIKSFHELNDGSVYLCKYDNQDIIFSLPSTELVGQGNFYWFNKDCEWLKVSQTPTPEEDGLLDEICEEESFVHIHIYGERFEDKPVEEMKELIHSNQVYEIGELEDLEEETVKMFYEIRESN